MDELPVVPAGPAQGAAVEDMNAHRKLKKGLLDDGMCTCAMYPRVACRTYCLAKGERHEDLAKKS